jgi:hypothetical protein
MRYRLGAALAALALPVALSSAQAQAPGRAPAGRPPAPAAQQQPAPPPIFPCRTEQETCFLGFVVGSQVLILFTNAQNVDDTDKPVDVAGADGAKADLSTNAGRVVMLAGTYDPKAGIKGEVVEVASPLVSLSIKAQLGGDAPEAPAAADPKPAQPKGRR